MPPINLYELGFDKVYIKIINSSMEMGLFILVLFGMELILSVWTIRRQKKQSLIEQMRAME